MTTEIDADSYRLYKTEQSDTYHRKPHCAQGQRVVEDAAIEVHGGNPNLSNVELYRAGDVELTEENLCSNCASVRTRGILLGNGVYSHL